MYDHKTIDKKWQKKWQEDKIYKTSESQDKPKYYVLDMFPYPSGAGLHVGHPKGYIATDVSARFKTLNGFNVLHPMGWDAFGLPAENYAIKNKVHPKIATEQNVERFKKQLEILGFTYDWDREINTTDPNYYKWTQWIFLQMFKKGLAYESHEPINWCPSCKTGLANEDLEDGKCERCGSEIEQKPMRQWVLKITDYAEKLLDGLKDLDWEDSIIEMQKNWIGKKQGINITYEIEGIDEKVIVFTTRPDTNFGATFVVAAPDSNFVAKNIKQFPNQKEVIKYVEEAKKKTEMDRIKEGRKKTGVFTGLYAVNTLNNKKMPLYIGDFVLASVGTGVVVGVPGHDLRDFEFAKAFDLEIIRVVVAPDGDKSEITKPEQVQEQSGKMINSEFLNNLDIKKATEKIMDYMEEKGMGKRVINYKLKDWVFSRQRYWGEPIPLVYCENCKKRVEDFIQNTKTPEKNSEALGGSKDSHPQCESRSCHLINIIYNINKNVNSAEPVEGLEPSNHSMTRLDSHHATGKSTPNELYQKNNNNTKTPENSEALGDIEDCHPQCESGTCHYVNNIAYNEKKVNSVEPVEGLEPSDKEMTSSCPHHATGKSTPNKLYQKNNNNTKTPEKNSEDFDGIEGCCPRCKTTVCHLDNNIIYNSNKNVKDNSAEPVEGLEPSVHQMTNREQHHATGKSTPNELYQKNKDFTKGELLNPGWIIDENLPLELPEVENYEPSGTGESPLANITEWVNTKCPKCGEPAKRETNTMPQWAGSCWYYLRYIDPKNSKKLVNPEKEKYWQPVDLYVGGAEHATRHLIYSRFWHHFLYDIGAVSTPEPFKKLQHVGLIMAEDGRKMSKRWNNVINPDDVVEKYGADAMRVYEMFMGPFDNAIAWSDEGLVGARRFLERVWKLKSKISFPLETEFTKSLEPLLHKTIKKITNDIQNFKFNTAISSMMILLNAMEKEKEISKDHYANFLILLSPFAPHITEELWHEIGNTESIFKQSWPKYKEELIKDEKIELVVQINGKVRDRITVEAGISEEQAKETALASEKVKKWLDGKDPKKVIFVKGKLVSIVI